MIKTIQYTSSPTYRKVGYTWFACNSCKVKKCKENKLKVHINTVHGFVKKKIPNETPKIPILCYNCTECYLTFEARHKLKKHTKEKHESKFIKSPERISYRTELKTNIKMSNSNKEEFNKQVTAEGEEINVKIVTINVKELENLQNILTQTEQENEQLKSDKNNSLNLKKIWLKSLKN